MPFSDLVLWISMAVFLVGVVFVFEEALSSAFGFLFLMGASAFLATHFWMSESLVFGIMFAVIAILAVRYFIGQIPSQKGRWW